MTSKSRPPGRPATPQLPAPTAEAPQQPQVLHSFAPAGLTRLQWAFVQEFVAEPSLNATRAYLKVAPNVTEESARAEASRMLVLPNVKAEVQKLMDERSAITGVRADSVLLRLWNMATVDVRDLVEYRIGSCRYCWGLYNQFQYTDSEFQEAQDKHIREQASKRKRDAAHEEVPFPEKGGPGFTPSKPPNPDCPECWGEGKGMPIVKDTRHLPPGAAMLYEGIKVTKDGMQVLLADRTKLIELVGRHLGMWSDKDKVPEETSPLHALLRELQAKGSSLPIAHADPERVTDVVSRPSSTPPAAKAVKKPAAGGWKAKT